MTKLGVSVSQGAANSVVTVVGELDVISADDLRAALGELLEEGRTRLIIDVTGLTFCDSMGLRLLLEFLDRSTKSGGFLRLAGVRGVLERVLTVTGLNAAFPIYETAAEAAGN
jgi:anti-sigma B factor antagonist